MKRRVRCPHCGSSADFYVILPSSFKAGDPSNKLSPNANDSSECELYIKRVFEAVVKHYGEDEARRIFGPYGKQRTKREKNLENNALLFTEYLYERVQSKGKPNVRKLARRLANENNTDPVAMERKIWRAIKSKKVRQYLLEH
jgi:rRNA maturation protein Nop10